MAGTERGRLGEWGFLSITVGLEATLGQLRHWCPRLVLMGVPGRGREKGQSAIESLSLFIQETG